MEPPLERNEPGLEVRVIELPPMRGAWVRAVSEHPEKDAWEALKGWAEPVGLLADPEQHPIFGWNDPSPTPGVREYGYALWIRIGSDVDVDLGPDVEDRPEAGVESGPEAMDLPGGRYAVARCLLAGDPNGSVSDVWRKLLDHVADSDLRWRGGRELERLVNPADPEDDWVLELYLPVTGSWVPSGHRLRPRRR